MSTLLQHERCSLLKGRFLPTTYIFSTRKMSTSNFFHPTVFNRPKLNVVKNYPQPSPSLDLIILLMRSLDHATYFNLKIFQKNPDHTKIIFCTIWCHIFSMVFIKDFKSVLIKCDFSPYKWCKLNTLLFIYCSVRPVQFPKRLPPATRGPGGTRTRPFKWGGSSRPPVCPQRCCRPPVRGVQPRGLQASPGPPWAQHPWDRGSPWHVLILEQTRPTTPWSTPQSIPAPRYKNDLLFSYITL